jgi:hypothetical protein
MKDSKASRLVKKASLSADSSDRKQQPESDYILCLLAVIAPWLGLLLLSLKRFGPIPFTQEQESDLTNGGRFWVHLERDIPLYITAVAALLLLLALVPWHRCAHPSRPGLTRCLAGMGVGLFMAPVLFWEKLAVLPTASAGWTLPALFCALALGVSGTCIALLSFRKAVQEDNEPAQNAVFHIQPPTLGGKDFAFFGFLSFLILIPHPAYLAGRIFQIEELNHWNGFVMSAALAFKHGAALYRDFTPIYGAGWPAIFGYLATHTGLSYSHALLFSMVFTALYLSALYFFFQFFFKGRLAPLAFALLACVISVFPSGEPETKSVIWRWNGGAILRSPADLPFLIFLARFCLRQTRWDAILLGVALGSGVLFALDVGVFLLSTAMATWALLLMQSRTTQRLTDCICSFGAAFLTSVGGLYFATRGAIFESQTQKNLFEYMRRATGGEGMIPFAGLNPFWVFLFAILMLLLFCLAAEFFKRCAGRLNASDIFLLTAALYPMQRLVYFMGRTHWSLLSSVSVPLLIGLVVLINATILQRPLLPETDPVTTKRLDRLETGLASGVLLLAFLLFCLSKDTPNYPALWNVKARRDLTEHTGSVRPAEGDIMGLPPQYAAYARDYAATALRMRELHQSGLRVRFLDACSTTLYVSADIPPFGRDVFEFDRADTSRKEIQKLVNGIALQEADVVVFNRVQFPWPRALSAEAWTACRDAMFEHYRRGEEQGPFEFWHRRDRQKSK